MTTIGNENEHRSSDRLIRTIARFVAAGYLIYFVILLPEFLRTSFVTQSWFTPTALIVVFGTGFSMGLASLARDTVWIRITGRAATFSFLAVALLWWVARNPDVADSGGVPLSSFPGLAGLAAAASLPAWLAFAQMVVAIVSVQLAVNVVRGPLTDGPLFADILFALMFCSIFFGATLGVLRTARILDATIESTHRQAAAEAAVSARTVERERFDALIHDGVLSSLLAVARQGRTEGVVRQTQHTLAQLDSLRDHAGATEFDVDETIAQLRSAATGIDEDLTLTTESSSAALYPADAVRTVSAALAEAVRNSVRHAGDAASRVVAITLSDTGMHVRLSDDGRGFDPAGVSTHRMGIAVSITGRMKSLPGGSSDIVSTRSGGGTVVTLRWQAA